MAILIKNYFCKEKVKNRSKLLKDKKKKTEKKRSESNVWNAKNVKSPN